MPVAAWHPPAAAPAPKADLAPAAPPDEPEPVAVLPEPAASPAHPGLPNPQAEPPGAAVERSDEPEVPAEAPPSPADDAIDLAAARSRMVACLGAPSAAAADGSDVRVIISSTVRLQLDADRRIISVRFMPPLKPDLQQRCAGTLFGRRLAGTGTSAQFHVQFSPR